MIRQTLMAGGLILAATAGMASPAFAQATLESVASFDHQVTGVTVTPDGRRFVNFPRWTEDSPVSVAEVGEGGSLKAYPNDEWNSWRNEKANQIPVGNHFVCVQAVVADGRGNLWVVDPGAPGNEKILPKAPKLVQIRLDNNEVVKVLPMPENVALQGTYLNDLRISPDGKTGYITDSGTRGAIIVVNLENGEAFRALDGDPSTQIDPTVTVTVEGQPLRRPDGRQPAFAADGIALSNDGETLYFQALTGKTLYSIETSKLTRGTEATEQSRAVKKVADSQVADGLWMSKAGTLYVTSPSDNSVKQLKDGKLENVVSDERLRWPDTMSEGPDGRLYVTASHIQDTNWFKPGAPAALKTELFSFMPPK